MSDDVRQDFVPDPDFSQLIDAPNVSPVGEESDRLFPKEIEHEVEGLLYLGALSTVETIWGHTFEIHTLKAGEELVRDQIVSEYEGMLGQSKALGLATVAAAVKAIDGTPLARPLSPAKNDLISAIRSNFSLFGNYYLPVIEKIYEAYEELEVKQARAFKALEGK